MLRLRTPQISVIWAGRNTQSLVTSSLSASCLDDYLSSTKFSEQKLLALVLVALCHSILRNTLYVEKRICKSDRDCIMAIGRQDSRAWSRCIVLAISSGCKWIARVTMSLMGCHLGPTASRVMECRRTASSTAPSCKLPILVGLSLRKSTEKARASKLFRGELVLCLSMVRMAVHAREGCLRTVSLLTQLEDQHGKHRNNTPTPS